MLTRILTLQFLVGLPLTLRALAPAWADADGSDSAHSYTFALRGAAWISKLDGDMGPVGTSDLKLDDFEPGASLEGQWRFGKHEIGGGYRYYWLHVDLKDDNNIDLDLDLWGPEAGIELRFRHTPACLQQPPLLSSAPREA